MRLTSRAWVCAGLLVTAGCAAGRTAAPLALHPAESIQIANVPFFPDDTDQCGPATLAALMTFWGTPVAPADLRSEIYLPNVGGTLPMDLLPAVRARGLSGAVTNGTLDDLKENLRRGRPVLAYLDFGIGPVNWGHYVLVTGFDDRGITAHSGKERDARLSYRALKKSWDRTDRWMLVVDGPAEGKAKS